MAFRALCRAAAKPQRSGAWRNLVQQQPLKNEAAGPAAAAARFSPSDVNSAGNGGVAPWGPATFRMASTAREMGRDGDSGLVSILRNKLDHERKFYWQNKESDSGSDGDGSGDSDWEEVARGPPKPWQMTERQGHEDIILRRSHGQEDIAVTCVHQGDHDYEGDVDCRDTDDDEENPPPGHTVSMIITINKGSTDPTLEISAVSYGSPIIIENVFFWEAQDKRETLYQGPDFMHLDEELKEQFEKFIRARGIDKDLSGFLFSALADKEQREYMRWLQKVEAFVKQ